MALIASRSLSSNPHQIPSRQSLLSTTHLDLSSLSKVSKGRTAKPIPKYLFSSILRLAYLTVPNMEPPSIVAQVKSSPQSLGCNVQLTHARHFAIGALMLCL